MGQIIIDGVIFEFDETGEKMIKIGSVAAQEASGEQAGDEEAGAAGPSSRATPLQASVDGQKFVRTKNGNLISAEILAQRKAQKELSIKTKRLAQLGKSIGNMQKARYESRPGGKNKTLGSDKPKGLCSYFNKTGGCPRPERVSQWSMGCFG